MITVVANFKGGSGKSTIAFNLALWLLNKNINVKVFDLDPQRTLTDVSRIRLEDMTEPALLVDTNIQHLHEYKADDADQVLIDVGVSDMEAMKTAISLTDRIIIPVPPSQPDVWATHRFLKIVRDTREKDDYPEMLAFINRADTHKDIRESDEAEEALNMLPDITVLSQRLCQRTIFRRTLSEGMAVYELEKSSKGAKEFEQLSQVLFADL